MKYLYRIFVIILIIISFSSCSDKQNQKKITSTDTNKIIKSIKTQELDTIKKINIDTFENSKIRQKKEAKIYKYICPLGCKKGNSNIKKNCPECGMELIENPDCQTKNSKNNEKLNM